MMNKFGQFVVSFPKMHLLVIAVCFTIITVSFATARHNPSASLQAAQEPNSKLSLDVMPNLNPVTAPSILTNTQPAILDQAAPDTEIKPDTPEVTEPLDATSSVPSEDTEALLDDALVSTAQSGATAESEENQTASAEDDEHNSLMETSITVVSGDTLSSLFERANIPLSVMYQILALGNKVSSLKSIYPGEVFYIIKTPDDQLQKISYQIDPVTTLHIERDNNQFVVNKEQKPVETRRSFKQVTINDSVFIDGLKAGLSDNIIMQLTDIYAWDIDFIFDIRAGDTFSILYDEEYVDGEKYRDGKIVAAEFHNQGEVLKAIRFTDSNDVTGYFDEKGLSMQKAFLRVPVDVGRVSSNFNPNRKHPILHTIIAHKGTDYAAPRGTPVKAAGNGKIVFAGDKGGYGNVIYLQHGQHYETRYAHLQGFAKNIKAGRTVKQGQIIGYIGTSGRSTGPHLHYEFIVDGVHRDSRTIPLPKLPVDKKDQGRFKALAKNLFNDIDREKQVMLAHTDEAATDTQPQL